MGLRRRTIRRSDPFTAAPGFVSGAVASGSCLDVVGAMGADGTRETGEMTLKCDFDYSAWCDRQAVEIVRVMREAGRNGTMADAAFFLVECTEEAEGRLILSDDYPPGMCPVIRLGNHRTWRTIPYNDVSALIYTACRGERIIPACAWREVA
jgi:hypothetical protein